MLPIQLIAPYIVHISQCSFPFFNLTWPTLAVAPFMLLVVYNGGTSGRFEKFNRRCTSKRKHLKY